MDGRCKCGCGRRVTGRYAYYNASCRKRLRAARSRRLVEPLDIIFDAIVRRDPCTYCGATEEFWKPEIGADHIVPVSRGGDIGWVNLTGCCSRCNSAKHDRPFWEYLLRRREHAYAYDW